MSVSPEKVEPDTETRRDSRLPLLTSSMGRRYGIRRTWRSPSRCTSSEMRYSQSWPWRSACTRGTLSFSASSRINFLRSASRVCVAWLVVRPFRSDLESLGFRFPGFSTLVKALLSLAPIFLGSGTDQRRLLHLSPGFHLQGNVKQELPVGTHVNILRAILILVWASVEAPLVEETLFRGIIFQGVAGFASRRLGPHLSVFLGALVSGVIFGLVHFEAHTLPILAFLGIALAYIFYYSRSLYASMLVHGTVNAIAAITVFHGG